MKLITEEKLNDIINESSDFQNIDNFSLSEPRLELISKRVKALLSVIELEDENGMPLDISSFRLKNLENWTSKVGPPFSDLWYISTACNMRCPFCYEEGDPFEGSVLNEPSEMLSIKELETRLKYRNKKNGTGLFQPITYINEMFCHPSIMQILKRIRDEYPNEVLTFVTNGTYFDEETIKKLADLKPIFFNFSVNSLDPIIRKRILRDMNPDIAIKSIKLLARYEIPYLASLVCWPTIPWEDIERTCKILDENKCTAIRFSLSAYSKFLKGRKFDRLTFWDKGVSVAKKLMSEIETPIKIEPYHYANPTYKPVISGVIVNSSAYKAGILADDCIISINNKNIPTSNHALSEITKLYNDGVSPVIKIFRESNNKEYSFIMKFNDEFTYPYEQLKNFSGFEYGVLLIDNLKFKYLKEMKRIIDEHKAKKILLCSSEIMKPIVQQMINHTNSFNDLELFIEVPKNIFFGGTVVLGDLLVVQDFIDFIQEFKKINQIDLVIIPSSPFSNSQWLRDLRGVPFNNIERIIKTPVRLVFCNPING